MKLILCGGGAGEKTIEINKRFNEIIDHTKPILYVPLAMDEVKHPYDGCLEWIKGELSTINVPSIDMVRTFDELASKNYFDYSAIFIGGGNTFSKYFCRTSFANLDHSFLIRYESSISFKFGYLL